MTIPDAIKHAYLAVAAGSKPHEREAARAIVWAVAGWLRSEWETTHHCANNPMWPQRGYQCNDERHQWLRDDDWIAEADSLLREETGGNKNETMG